MRTRLEFLKDRIVFKCPFCGGRRLEMVDDCSTARGDLGFGVCCNRIACGAASVQGMETPLEVRL